MGHSSYCNFCETTWLPILCLAPQGRADLISTILE